MYHLVLFRYILGLMVLYCLHRVSTLEHHMRESYYIKSWTHDPDSPMYMEDLSGENAEEYFKAMDDEIQSILIRDTC